MEATKPVLPKEWEINLAKLVAQTWTDENFRQRFSQEPEVILREAGIILEDSVKVIINSDSSSCAAIIGAEGGTTVYEICLPTKPNDLEEELIFDETAEFSTRAFFTFPFTFFSCC